MFDNTELFNEVNENLLGSNSRKLKAGRPRLLDEAERNYLTFLLRQRCNRHLKDLAKALYVMIDNEYLTIPSTCNIYRELHRMGYTLKVSYNFNRCLI